MRLVVFLYGEQLFASEQWKWLPHFFSVNNNAHQTIGRVLLPHLSTTPLRNTYTIQLYIILWESHDSVVQITSPWSPVVVYMLSSVGGKFLIGQTSIGLGRMSIIRDCECGLASPTLHAWFIIVIISEWIFDNCRDVFLMTNPPPDPVFIASNNDRNYSWLELAILV